MWRDLFENFGIMVMLVYAVTLMVNRWPLQASPKRVVGLMLSFSAVPLIVFLFSAQLIPGLWFDLRHVPIALVTLAAGPVPGLLLALPFLLYRLFHYTPASLAATLGVLLLVGITSQIRRSLGVKDFVVPITLRQWPIVALMFSLNGLPVLLFPNGIAALQASYLPMLLLNVLGFYLAFNIFHDRIRLLSSLKSANDEARLDRLSGIYNRRQFDLDLPHLQADDLLVMLDIDHFKRINDTYGHAIGDQVLSAVGQTLLHALRQSDSAYRYGGEEFAVIFRRVPPEHAGNLASRLHQKIATVQVEGVPDLRITASLGVSVGGEHSPSDRLLRADQALYRAKENGRNRVELTN